MKEKFNKFKKWLFRPVSARIKTYGIIYGLVALFIYSFAISFCIHWALCILPIIFALIVVYCAKLPIDVKKTIEDQQKMEAKRNAKKEK